MRAAREVAVLPKLALALVPIGPNTLVLSIRNVGPGAALDVDVSIHLDPRTPGQSEPQTFHWKWSVMPPGDEQRFATASDHLSSWDELSEAFATIRLTGVCKDALGNSRLAEDNVDVAELKRMIDDTDVALAEWRYPDPERRLAKALTDDLAKLKPLRDIAKELTALRRALDERRPE